MIPGVYYLRQGRRRYAIVGVYLSLGWFVSRITQKLKFSGKVKSDALEGGWILMTLPPGESNKK